MLTPLLERFADRSSATVLLGSLLERTLSSPEFTALWQRSPSPESTREQLCSILCDAALLLMADPAGDHQVALENQGEALAALRERLGAIDDHTLRSLVKASVIALEPFTSSNTQSTEIPLLEYRHRWILTNAPEGPHSGHPEPAAPSPSFSIVWDPSRQLAIDAFGSQNDPANNPPDLLEAAAPGDLWIGEECLFPGPVLEALAVKGAFFIVCYPPHAAWESGAMPIAGIDIIHGFGTLETPATEGHPWRWVHLASTGPNGRVLALATNLSGTQATTRLLCRLYLDYAQMGFPVPSCAPIRNAAISLRFARFDYILLAVAGNILATFKALLQDACRVANMPLPYYPALVREIAATWRGMRIAVLPEQWEFSCKSSIPNLARTFRQWADQTVLPSSSPASPSSTVQPNPIPARSHSYPLSVESKSRSRLEEEWRQMRAQLSQLEKREADRQRLEEDRANALHLLPNMSQEDDILSLLENICICLKERGFPLQGHGFCWFDDQREKAAQTATFLTRRSGAESWQISFLSEPDPRIWEKALHSAPYCRSELSEEERDGLQTRYAQQVRSVLEIPLMRGFIQFVHAQPGIFSEQDIDLVGEFKSILRIGLSRIQDFHDTRLRVQQAQLTALQMPLIRSLDTLLQAIVENAIRLLGAQRGLLFLYDEKEGTFAPRAQIGFPNEIFLQLRLLPDEGLPGRVFTQEKSLLVPRDPYPAIEPPRPSLLHLFVAAGLTSPGRSILAIPLNVRGSLSGILLVDTARRDFSPHDQRTLSHWGKQVSGLLERIVRAADPETLMAERQIAEKDLSEELRIRDAESSISLQIALMEAPVDLFTKVLVEIENQMGRLGVPFDTCSTQIFNAEGTNFLSFSGDPTGENTPHLDTIAGYGDWSGLAPHAQQFPWVAEVWKTGKPRHGSCTWKTAAGLGERSLLDVPFCQGTLAINGLGPNVFSDRDVEILQRFARLLSLAYERFIDLSQRQRSEEALQESQKRLEEFSRRLLHLQEQERRNVARDLHDGINQILSAAQFNLSALENQLSAGKDGLAQIGKTRNLLENAIAEIRHISHDLRPSILDDLGLEAAVRSLCEDFTQRTRVHVKRVWGDVPLPLNKDAEITLYRILQEALHNIEKHAQTRQVQIFLFREDGHITLQIKDDGRGFEPARGNGVQNGAGLTNIQDRAALMGGTAIILSEPGNGTEVIVRIPL